MAKVKYPLHSLSASGSVGGTITYNKVANQKRRVITRLIDGDIIPVLYEPRIISGRGIAKSKIHNKGFRARKKPQINKRLFFTEADKAKLLKATSIIASWMVRNNISVSKTPPMGAGRGTPPAHHGYLLGRSESREIKKFPGQATGESLSFRRRIEVPKNGYTYIIKSLLIQNYIRFLITGFHWNRPGRIDRELWRPAGNAPFDELPELLDLPLSGVFNHTFINVWVQVSYLIPRFQLRARWYNRGPEHALYTNPNYSENTNPAYPAYLDYINNENDITSIQNEPWVPTSR